MLHGLGSCMQTPGPENKSLGCRLLTQRGAKRVSLTAQHQGFYLHATDQAQARPVSSPPFEVCCTGQPHAELCDIHGAGGESQLQRL